MKTIDFLLFLLLGVGMNAFFLACFTELLETPPLFLGALTVSALLICAMNVKFFWMDNVFDRKHLKLLFAEIFPVGIFAITFYNLTPTHENVVVVIVTSSYIWSIIMWDQIWRNKHQGGPVG